MEQFDQLLTCCICLDRYRTPKLLPCQHSYCLDPCMEGLVDYVKRQVKCPECRAEHRIPYNGIQGFPTNYTLTKFLELHADITGKMLILNPLEKQYCIFKLFCIKYFNLAFKKEINWSHLQKILLSREQKSIISNLMFF